MQIMKIKPLGCDGEDLSFFQWLISNNPDSDVCRRYYESIAISPHHGNYFETIIIILFLPLQHLTEIFGFFYTMVIINTLVPIFILFFKFSQIKFGNLLLQR